MKTRPARKPAMPRHPGEFTVPCHSSSRAFRQLGNRFLPLLALLGAVLSGSSAVYGVEPEQVEDQGVFYIFSGNRRVGMETFSIQPTDSGFEATGELELDSPGGPKTSETSLLRVNRNLQPSFYERKQESPREGRLAAEFGPSETRLVSMADEGAPQEQIFFLPDNVVVLDTNFFHHYSFLVHQYQSSGPQPFNVFIPQEALPGTVTLELQGRQEQTLGNRQLSLHHFQAVTDELSIDIWASEEGRVQRIAIPQANLEILRRELAEER